MTEERVVGSSVEEIASVLLDAERRGVARGRLTEQWDGLDPATAYAVQDETLRVRQARGERLIGVKAGLTSRAKQLRMGVDSPVTGWLTDAMLFQGNVELPLDRLIHPRAEPEIVLVLGQRLEGPNVSIAEAMAAVDRVYGGIEVIDSRFQNYDFGISDVIADNTSAALVLLGPIGVPIVGLDLTQEACVVEVDGRARSSATGAAVLGHPAQALAVVANSLAERGRALEAGWLVLTGGLTDAVDVGRSSSIRASFSSLGSIWLQGGRGRTS